MINAWNLLWIIPAAVSFGALCGVVAMCLLQISHGEREWDE